MSLLAQTTEIPWLTIVGQGGLLIVAIVLYQGIKMLINGTLHGDKEFKSMEKDRDFWRDIGMRSTKAGETIADAAKSVTPEELERVAYQAAAKAAHEATKARKVAEDDLL
jgi:hypothetical protein